MPKKVTMIASALSPSPFDTGFRSQIRGIGALSPAWAWVQGVAYYTVAAGDTLGALAAKYLGSSARYKEIWQVQDDAYRATRGNAGNIRIGDRLVMPFDAAAKAQELGLLGPTPPDAPDDKKVVYTLPEITIYGDTDKVDVAPLPVKADTPAAAPSWLEKLTADLEPWQKWAIGGALLAGTAGATIVIAKRVKKGRRSTTKRGRR